MSKIAWIFLLWAVAAAPVQQAEIDLNKLQFKRLGFSIDKQTVINAFGKPEIKTPDYECGFYEPGP